MLGVLFSTVESAIGVFAVGDAKDEDREHFVRNVIDHSIVAYTNAVSLIPNEFFDPKGKGFKARESILWAMRTRSCLGSASIALRAEGTNWMEYGTKL
jgi:hypothetical protein